jgi:hypothetical protein
MRTADVPWFSGSGAGAMSLSDETMPRPGDRYAASLRAPSSDGLGTAATLGLAVLVTMLPVVMHLTGQAAGIAVCFALALLVANFAAAAAPVVLIFSYVFQNLFVALISPQIGDLDEFNAIRAYNFILTAAVWAVVAGSYWIERASFEARLRSVIDLTTVALAFIGLYFLIGARIDPSGASVYLRNIAAPFLLFQIFAIVAYRYRVSVTTALILVATAALIFGYIELLAPEKLFRLINGDIYLKWRMKQEYESGAWLKEMHETGRVYRSYLDAMVVNFLNTPFFGDLGLRFHRIVGPNFHPISFAYCLAIFSVLFVAIGQWWFAIVAFPVLLVIGSKGALLLVVGVIAARATVLRFRGLRPLWVYTALLLCYAAAAIVIGIKGQDYHVIGFIGGLNGFLKNPFGHGIGVGGNLSLNMTVIDWNRSQSIGSTDVAVESAVGVLLFQMGVFGIALLAILGSIAVSLWKLYSRTRDQILAVAALGLLTIIVNGIFQEEALFSPVALGLMLAFSGALLGRCYRVAAVRDVGARQSRLPAQLAGTGHSS